MAPAGKGQHRHRHGQRGLSELLSGQSSILGSTGSPALGLASFFQEFPIPSRQTNDRRNADSHNCSAHTTRATVGTTKTKRAPGKQSCVEKLSVLEDPGVLPEGHSDGPVRCRLSLVQPECLRV